MVKITDGKNVFEVTQGAYTGIYKRQGYRLLDCENERSDDAPEMTDDDVDTDTESDVNLDEVFCYEMLEKPIAQWSNKEIKKFAMIKGIDISNTKSANEAREIIKSFVNK